jgi:hypothetical protein
VRAAEPPAEKPPGVIDGFAGSYTTVLTLDHREDLPNLSRRLTASEPGDLAAGGQELFPGGAGERSNQ